MKTKEKCNITINNILFSQFCMEYRYVYETKTMFDTSLVILIFDIECLFVYFLSILFLLFVIFVCENACFWTLKMFILARLHQYVFSRTIVEKNVMKMQISNIHVPSWPTRDYLFFEGIVLTMFTYHRGESVSKLCVFDFGFFDAKMRIFREWSCIENRFTGHCFFDHSYPIIPIETCLAMTQPLELI